MTRSDGRQFNELRQIEFETNYIKWPEGSVLAKFGDTHVLCNVTIEDRVPRWLHQSRANHGWLTAEYALLPRSTQKRVDREQKWPKGRTQEISRLIGRSLRMSLDLTQLGQRQLVVDCDVLQADGGTRTAAVTGGWLAANIALKNLIAQKGLPPQLIKYQIAAISVGMVDGVPLLDLNYKEDYSAEADLNVVMTGEGDFIEVQGTGEKKPIPRDKLNALLDLAEHGCKQLFAMQAQALSAHKAKSQA